MEVVFHSTMNQMVVLFLFMAAGYLLRKKNLLGQDTGKALSNMELYVFNPCLNLITFARNCTWSALKENVPLLLLACALLAVLIPLARLLARLLGRTEGEKAVYRYALCFANYGYLGYPIVKAVFGEMALMDMMIFCIPINVATYTYGLYTLIPKEEFSLKKLWNPSTITPFIGIAIGLSGIELPEALSAALDTGSDCLAPVAMILTGFVLARQPLGKMFGNVRAYIASLLRLIVIPLLTGAVLYALGMRENMLMIAAATLAMPMGLNSVVFPEAFGGDATSGSQATFISNIIGIVTIPVMMTLFHVLAFPAT